MGNCFVLKKYQLQNSSCAKARQTQNKADDHVGIKTSSKDCLLTNINSRGGSVGHTTTSAVSTSDPAQSFSSLASVAVGGEGRRATAKRRIKVVITKQQLQELLSKKEISLGDLLWRYQSSIPSTSSTTNQDSTHYKLESIPEENDESF